MLRYLLDTNICIYIAKEKPVHVLHKFERLSVGEVGMSIITYGELMYGAQKSHSPKIAIHTLEALAFLISPIDISIEVAKHYGETRGYLEKKGTIIGNNDLWIAAHALALKITLVTNNLKEFSRVPHLKLENWAS